MSKKNRFPWRGDLTAFLLEKLSSQGLTIPKDFDSPSILTRWEYRDEEVGFVIILPENHYHALNQLARRLFGKPQVGKGPGGAAQSFFARKSDGVILRLSENRVGMDIVCLGLERNRAEVVRLLSEGIRAAILEVAREEFDTPVPPGTPHL